VQTRSMGRRVAAVIYDTLRSIDRIDRYFRTLGTQARGVWHYVRYSTTNNITGYSGDDTDL
jgi:hypothetical protein